MYLMIAVDARGREWTTSYTSSDPEAAEQLAREHTQMSQHSWSLVGHSELAWTYIVKEKNERAATHIDVWTVTFFCGLIMTLSPLRYKSLDQLCMERGHIPVGTERYCARCGKVFK